VGPYNGTRSRSCHHPVSSLQQSDVKNAAYERQIQGFDWTGLRDLYARIVARDTPGWEPGRAFEYLIPRAFELDGARVRWPYEIELHGHIVEQIDGAVEAAGLYCLLECKDQVQPLAIAPVAKMRNQLSRRPAACVGLIFSMSGYTRPAQVLTGYLGTQTILLWHSQEIQLALETERIVPLLEAKYRLCMEEGIHDVDLALSEIL
jgi:hypothetical protein